MLQSKYAFGTRILINIYFNHYIYKSLGFFILILKGTDSNGNCHNIVSHTPKETESVRGSKRERERERESMSVPLHK